MSEIEAPIRGLAAVVRRADALERLAEDPDGFLKELDVNEADRKAMLEIGVDRLRAYRALVQNRFANVIARFLPRTEHFVGKAELRKQVEAFVAERAAQSPYLRSIPVEFVDWALPRWSADPELPAFVGELARYELLSETVPNDPVTTPAATGAPVALDRPILANPTARLCGFDFAVDEVAEKDPRPPKREAITLLVCRGHDFDYHQKRLTPLAATLFERLAAGEVLQAAIFAAAEAIGEVVADPLLEKATYALSELSKLDALLGPPPD